MKVLLINKFHYRRGGSETYHFALAEALIAKGHEVVYFAMKDDRNVSCEQSDFFVSNVDYNEKQNIGQKISLGIRTIYSFEAKKKIKELIKKEKPDVAHIGLLHRQLTFSVVDVLKEYNIPTVMMIHDLIYLCPNYTMLCNDDICNDCVTKGLFQCAAKKCVKNSFGKSFLAVAEAKFLEQGKYYNKINLYIAVSKMYKRMMEKARFTESPIVYMPNFLPKDHVYEYISGYKNYILYLGRLSREKGILTLLKAHQISNCKHHLIIAGDGPLKQQINDYIEENNITNVELAGFVKGQELAELVNNAHTIVVPSEWYENCPYSLLEALGKGKIVIASKIGGLPELIKDKETGYLFSPGNEQDLADRIKTVMSMKKREYNKMSKQVLKKAEEKFSWDKYIDKMIKQYNKLIKSYQKI